MILAILGIKKLELGFWSLELQIFQSPAMDHGLWSMD